MPRIAGVDIPQEKNIKVALTYIHGVGRSLSNKIVAQSGIEDNKRVKDLTEAEMNEIRKLVESKQKVEGELQRAVLMNIKRLKEINCYRGARHTKGLPVRGQRTKTNSRTVRGNVRRTAGSGRKPAAQKT